MSDPSAPPDVPWWQPGRARKPQLDLERIVQAAIDTLQRGGPEQLTIRGLAAELGVAPASVYWYLPNKQALLDVVLDRLLGEVVAELGHAQGATWRAQLADICRALHRLVERTPAAAVLLGERLPVGPNGLRLMEIVMEVLGRAGFIGQRLALAHGAVLGYASGLVALSMRRPGAAPLAAEAATPEAGQMAALGRLLSGAPRQHYPALFEMADEIAGVSDEELFEYGLQRMLDGLEQDLRGGSGGVLRRRF